MSMAFSFEASEAEEQLLAKALYVDEGDEDEADVNQPPATAQEYLRRVIKEAKQVVDVGVASNIDQILQKGATPKAPTHVDRSKATVPDSFLPTREWQNKQVSDFSSLRLILERNVAQTAGDPRTVKFPLKSNEKGWCTFCYGNAFWERVEAARKALDSDSADEEAEEDENPSKRKKEEKIYKQEAPTTQILCQLKPSQVEMLIEYQVEWAEVVGVTIPEQGLWLYSLMARLEKPLHPDSGSTIRTLAMICSKERQKIYESGEAIGRPENEGMLIHLNLLICLVARYFDQLDLAD